VISALEPDEPAQPFNNVTTPHSPRRALLTMPTAVSSAKRPIQQMVIDQPHGANHWATLGRALSTNQAPNAIIGYQHRTEPPRAQLLNNGDCTTAAIDPRKTFVMPKACRAVSFSIIRLPGGFLIRPSSSRSRSALPVRFSPHWKSKRLQSAPLFRRCYSIACGSSGSPGHSHDIATSIMTVVAIVSRSS